MRESGGVWEGQARDTVMGGSYRLGDFQRVSWQGVRDGGLGGMEKDSEGKGDREE